MSAAAAHRTSRAPTRRRRALSPGVGALALAVMLPACGGDEPTGAKSERASEGEPPQEGLGYLDELAELGYVDFGEDAGDEGSGVVLHEEGATEDGVNLYLSLPDSAAFLIDMDGEVLHGWRDESGAHTRWSRIEVLPDGDVVGIAPKENLLFRRGWSGEERWTRALDAHHDVRWTTGGEILVLTRELRSIPEVHPTRLTVDNGVARLDGAGNVLAEHSLYELLSKEPGIPLHAPDNVDQFPPSVNVDPIHANTIEPVESDALASRGPMYARGNVLLTLRYPCAVVMANLERGEVLWHWGPGVVEGPHDATLLANGNVLVLDNGWVERGFSRILEVEPASGEIVWEYRAPNPPDFFTAGRGTVQALPNGNVLVGNSNSGEAFEVTRAGRIVWRFLNPSVDENGARGVLRIDRLPRAALPLLGG